MKNRDVVNHFRGQGFPKGCCYRCFQTDKRTPATLGVVYNRGSAEEWSAPSCEVCFAKDRGAYGRNNVNIVLRLVGAGRV